LNVTQHIFRAYLRKEPHNICGESHGRLSMSVGARAAGKGGEGLYGRPRTPGTLHKCWLKGAEKQMIIGTFGYDDQFVWWSM